MSQYYIQHSSTVKMLLSFNCLSRKTDIKKVLRLRVLCYAHGISCMHAMRNTVVQTGYLCVMAWVSLIIIVRVPGVISVCFAETTRCACGCQLL